MKGMRARPCEQRHDSGAAQAVAQQDQIVRRIAQVIGRDHEQRLHHVDNEHRLVVIEARREQPVMDVIPVGRKRRTSFAQALHDDEQGIEQRQAQQQQTQQQKQQTKTKKKTNTKQKQKNKHTRQETKKMTAAGAHEDAGGMGI